MLRFTLVRTSLHKDQDSMLSRFFLLSMILAEASCVHGKVSGFKGTVAILSGTTSILHKSFDILHHFHRMASNLDGHKQTYSEFLQDEHLKWLKILWLESENDLIDYIFHNKVLLRENPPKIKYGM